MIVTVMTVIQLMCVGIVLTAGAVHLGLIDYPRRPTLLPLINMTIGVLLYWWLGGRVGRSLESNAISELDRRASIFVVVLHIGATISLLWIAFHYFAAIRAGFGGSNI